jgi:cobalt-precorrin-5B (C1)-methyltransferase
MSKVTPPVSSGGRKERLRCGFSTGTAAVAAAMAALRHLANGAAPSVVAVRLPLGIYLPIPIEASRLEHGFACASVIKDGGDDPDITHKAEIRARVRIVGGSNHSTGLEDGSECSGSERSGKQGVYLIAGTGVGIVTKAGLPVPAGEPAINPVPRQMFSDNVARELRRLEKIRREESASKNRMGCGTAPPSLQVSPNPPCPPLGKGGDDATFAGVGALQADVNTCLEFPGEKQTGCGRDRAVFVPFDSRFEGIAGGISVEVEIEVTRGKDLAAHTLNPRLGIVGGISILGTTGIVKPFSHKAYEETIQAALSVASSNGCDTVILSTGGKSERFARDMLPGQPVEAFIQIADFFAFAVREACRFGFKRIIHSVFFGKAVKMAYGHACTHAHTVPMELEQLSEIALNSGYGERFCGEIASANTARHAFEILGEAGAWEVVRKVAIKALAESARFAGEGVRVRLLLFDYDGRLLADES